MQTITRNTQRCRSGLGSTGRERLSLLLLVWLRHCQCSAFALKTGTCSSDVVARTHTGCAGFHSTHYGSAEWIFARLACASLKQLQPADELFGRAGFWIIMTIPVYNDVCFFVYWSLKAPPTAQGHLRAALTKHAHYINIKHTNILHNPKVSPFCIALSHEKWQ